MYVVIEANDDPSNVVKYFGRSEGFKIQNAKLNYGKRRNGIGPNSTLLAKLGYQLHDLAIITTRVGAGKTNPGNIYAGRSRRLATP